jgi:hypothetical protein
LAVALDDPKNQWSFCPSLPAAAFMACLFGLTTLFHTYQTIRSRKWYCAVIVMGAALETVAMISRYLSIQSPTSEALWAIWFVLVLVSPLWINAFVYMIMGRMVYNFVPSQKIGRIPARRFGVYFVLLDILYDPKIPERRNITSANVLQFLYSPTCWCCTSCR